MVYREDRKKDSHKGKKVLIAMQLNPRENVSLNSKNLDDVVTGKSEDLSTLKVSFCK